MDYKEYANLYGIGAEAYRHLFEAHFHVEGFTKTKDGIVNVGMSLVTMDEAIEACRKESKDLYAYVRWPESQEYMEEDWFEDEAVLDVHNDSACYFIPVQRIRAVDATVNK